MDKLLHRITRSVFILHLLFCAAWVHAAGYTASITTAYPKLTISNTVAQQVVWAAGNGSGFPSATMACDDCISQVMPIGFNFTFGGVSYPNWSMQSNGVIFFQGAGATGAGTTGIGTASGSSTYTPNGVPTSNFGTLGQPALMPFWADLIHNASSLTFPQSASASLYQYQVLTVSGTQVLVVQLSNVGYYSAPSSPVNMQIQIWATGQIVYAYGAMAAITSGNTGLTVGLQYPGGGCNYLANKLSTSLSNQSYLFTWDTTVSTCNPLPTVNHYEFRESGTATLCAEPVTVLACSSATSPCPAANIISNQLINAAVTVTGAGSLGTPNISPASFNLGAGSATQTVNLTWASGSSGTATLGIQAAISSTGALVCTNAAGTSKLANCNMVVANTACIAPPHHLQIQGPANGSTCSSSTFTINAWADAAETIPYTTARVTGTLTQSGNLASLPNLGAFTIPLGSSSVSITPISFIANGTTTFSTSTTPALAGATSCNFGGSTSCALVTSAASCVADFNCTETTANAATAADSNASTGRLYTKVAGTAFNFDVMARLAGGAVSTSYASDGNKTATVELVDGTTNAACSAYPALSPAVTAQTLSFTQANQPTQQGRQSVSFTVSNAYKNVRCRVTDNTGAQGCSQDNFAIRPPSATFSSSPAMGTPPSATSANPLKAGATFTLGASTSAGSNYSPSLTQDITKLSAQLTSNVLVQVAGGTVGSLTPANLVQNAALVNATYGEVGYLYLAAGAFYDAASPAFTNVDVSGGDCVAGSFSDTPVSGKVGCGIGTRAAAFGRFIPDHFETTLMAGTNPTTPLPCPSGLVCPANPSPGANGFVYASQPFTIKITAKNAAGGTTTNYQNSFATVNSLSAWSALGGNTANPGGGAISNATVLSTAFANGVASGTPAYGTTLPALLAPSDVFIRSTEVAGDGVTSLRTSSVEAGLKIASGRIRMSNAYGSDKLPLPLPIAVQYYTGSSWYNSTTDNTTTFNSALAPTGNLTATLVSGPANCISVKLPGTTTVASGVTNINLAATAKCTYNMLLTGMPSYLPVVPTLGGKATFGIYKSPLIYMRENY